MCVELLNILTTVDLFFFCYLDTVRNLMATINFYLDKEVKKGCCPIFLRVNSNSKQLKISIGKKVKVKAFA